MATELTLLLRFCDLLSWWLFPKCKRCKVDSKMWVWLSDWRLKCVHFGRLLWLKSREKLSYYVLKQSVRGPIVCSTFSLLQK